MKKILLLILLSASALICKAQNYSALADSAFNHKDYQAAYNNYLKVLYKDATNAKANRRVGFYLFSNLYEKEAIPYFAKAIEGDPTDKASYYYLGKIYTDFALAVKRTDFPKPTDNQEKAQNKALAELNLKKAIELGNEDAKAAIKELNGI